MYYLKFEVLLSRIVYSSQKTVPNKYEALSIILSVFTLLVDISFKFQILHGSLYSSEIYERISTSTRVKSIMQHRFKILWIKSLSLIIGNRHGLKLTLAKCVLKRADKTQKSTSYLHFDIWSKTSYSNHQFINEAFTTCYPLASNQISSLMI